MAYQRRLTDWILENSGPLDLRVRELTWIKSTFPGMADLSATITLGGQTFEGRGSDANEDTALCKAVCEAIERFVCQSNAISSTGVAGHFNEPIARRNAYLELIERISLFRHIESGVSMSKKRSRELKVLIGSRQTTMRLHLLEMTTQQEISAILCLAEGVTTDAAVGGILGLGCAESQNEAIGKAEIECLRNVFALAESPMNSLSKNVFSKIEKPNAEDRRRLLFNFDYCSHLLEILLGRVQEPGSAPVLRLQPIWTKLELPRGIPENCPLQFFRCMDPSNQTPLYLEFVG